jgi:hypothetical protein
MMTARELLSSNLAVGVGRTQGLMTKVRPFRTNYFFPTPGWPEA